MSTSIVLGARSNRGRRDGSDTLSTRQGKSQEENQKVNRRVSKSGGLVEGQQKKCTHSKRKFIIDESDDDSNLGDLLEGTRGRSTTRKRQKLIIYESDDEPSEALIPENVASPSVVSAMVKPNGKNQDMAWEWNSLKNIKDRQAVTCDFCLMTTNGGITRAKKHQIGLGGDVCDCKKIPFFY